MFLENLCIDHMQYISNWYTVQENQNTNIVELRMNLRLLEVHETNKNLKPELFYHAEQTLLLRKWFISVTASSKSLRHIASEGNFYCSILLLRNV